MAFQSYLTIAVALLLILSSTKVVSWSSPTLLRKYSVHSPPYSPYQSAPCGRVFRLQNAINNNVDPANNNANNANNGAVSVTSDTSTASEVFQGLVRNTYRSAWVSWWFQVVLSVVSGITLLFAKQQVTRGFTLWSSGFGLSALGVIVSYVNLFWTWNTTRLCKRISRNKVSKTAVKDSLRNCFRVSVAISLLGMFVSLLGAEQIVGTLASKILSSQSVGVFSSPVIMSGGVAANAFQALDIFLVQANTNTLVSHFAPLVCFLLLQLQL